MGRPERSLDPAAGPVQAFASELRLLRQRAGNPKYLQMQRRTGRSRTALAEAAGGDHLPTWETVEAYVRACGEDPAPWRARWELARDAMRSERGETASQASAAAAPRRPRASRLQRWLTAAAVAALLVAAITSTLNGFRPAGSVAIVIVVVQDKVAIGPSGLKEKTVPAYLSSRPVSSCAADGCEIPRSQTWSGTTLRATCRIRGARMTNEDLASPGIARNKNGITSSFWYRCVLPNGAAGYLPEVYVAQAYRGGQGLPTCS